MGVGGLLRDSHGNSICGFHAFNQGGNVLLSEALALKLGLMLSWERGFKDIICNLDCRDLLHAIGDTESHVFLPILKDIVILLKRQWCVTLEFIGRECNAPADWLARRGAFSQDPSMAILDSPPQELEILLLQDRLT